MLARILLHLFLQSHQAEASLIRQTGPDALFRLLTSHLPLLLLMDLLLRSPEALLQPG